MVLYLEQLYTSRREGILGNRRGNQRTGMDRLPHIRKRSRRTRNTTSTRILNMQITNEMVNNQQQDLRTRQWRSSALGGRKKYTSKLYQLLQKGWRLPRVGGRQIQNKPMGRYQTNDRRRTAHRSNKRQVPGDMDKIPNKPHSMGQRGETGETTTLRWGSPGKELVDLGSSRYREEQESKRDRRVLL